MEFRFLKTIKGFFAGVVPIAPLVWLLMCTFSCKQPDDTKAKGILSRQEMVSVLTEIYLAEEKVNRLTLPRDSAEVVFRLMEGKVFEMAGVPDSVFTASLNYYMDRPEQLELIYTALVDSLQLKEHRVSAGSN